MHLFYLQLEPNLSPEFFYLARVFQQYTISLVPISLSDLMNVKLKDRNYLVALDKSIMTKKNIHKSQSRYLDFLMNSGKMSVFHASSFGSLNVNHKAYRHNAYQHIPLPIEMDDLAKQVALYIYRDKQNRIRKWPGGRRAKLPV